jgi:hypothetical protein
LEANYFGDNSCVVIFRIGAKFDVSFFIVCDKLITGGEKSPYIKISFDNRVAGNDHKNSDGMNSS